MSDTIIKNLILAETKKILAKSNALFPRYPISFDELNISFNIRGVVAGKACYSRRTLQFNLILASENIITFLNDTVPHEIAHLYQRKIDAYSSPHGQLWKEVMMKMGYNPNRCHSYDTSNVRRKKIAPTFEYTCSCKKTFIISNLIHTRILGGSVRLCKACRGKIFLKVK